MSTYSAGKVSVTPRGQYSALTQYERLDVVSDNGSSYMYINKTPATGVSLSTTTHWMEIAQKGEQGLQGPQGPQGDPGQDGSGVPAGGTTGQVLSKVDNTDHNVEWADQTDGGVQFDAIYPVGAIYMSYASTSPATLFGGTWSALPTGKFLRVGAGGTTGGSDTHVHSTADVALTVAQMPSHRHNITYWPSSALEGSKSWIVNVGYTTSPVYGDGTPIQAAGGGEDHGHGNTGSASNVPAYYEVYAWRRTA